MHLRSEYKVKGGKLIKVILKVEGGLIREAMVAGDFFLYPEEAINGIERSLIGLSVDSMEVDRVLADAVKAAGAELLGVSVKDIATAVKLALQSKT